MNEQIKTKEKLYFMLFALLAKSFKCRMKGEEEKQREKLLIENFGESVAVVVQSKRKKKFVCEREEEK